MRVFSLLMAFGCAAGPAMAEVPRVASDIAPVHGLVSRVMVGVGTPDLILPPGASPHSYAMRPSEARALSQADMVVWVGPALTPWLAGSLNALAPDAVRLEWMESAELLPFREGALFEAHDHGHEEHGHADETDAHVDHDDHDDHDEGKHAEHDDDDHKTHGDEDHAEHGHEEHEAHGDEDHATKDHEEHAAAGHDEEEAHPHHDHAGQFDPHVWLDPTNGAAFMMRIAEQLGTLDPQNAEVYLENARAGQAELEAVTTQITQQMNAVQGRPFVVFHDAYHYFEARFGVEAVASINQADDSAASAGRLAQVREAAQGAAIACVFTEPQAPEGLVDAVAGKDGARIGIIDPIGAEIPLGAEFYPTFIKQIAASFDECLSED